MHDEEQLSLLHYHMIRGLIERGACPGNPELAQILGIPEHRVEELLRGLSDIHGVVLHPHVCEPWVVHPFSLTPTSNWVESENSHLGWWAPCIWCAFGVAVLAGGETRVHTRIGGEGESLVIPVNAGVPSGFEDLWVHFAIPPRKAWQNVHEHCAMVLAFRSPEAIVPWCQRHRLPQGEAVPLAQVAQLARRWYGTHGERTWHKWSVTEAQTIFQQVGLQSPFWDLESKSGKF